MVQRETDKVRTFVGDWDLERYFLGMGIGISGGALTGRAVYSEKEIEHFPVAYGDRFEICPRRL